MYYLKATEKLKLSSKDAGKLRTSMSMHIDQEYGKSIMTSYEFIDRDKGAKMLII